MMVSTMILPVIFLGFNLHLGHMFVDRGMVILMNILKESVLVDVFSIQRIEKLIYLIDLKTKPSRIPPLNKELLRKEGNMLH